MNTAVRTVVDKATGQIFHYTEDQYVKLRDKLLWQWQQAKLALEDAKATEARLRKEAVEFISDPAKEKGTERIPLANGYEAKCVKAINYGFIKREDNKVNKPAIEAALQIIEAEGPAGELIAERLIKWTPELSLTEYKLLKPEHKAAIDVVIVTTPGMPTLEIIPPKEKK